MRDRGRAYLALGALGLVYLLLVRGPAAKALFDAPVRPWATQLYTQAKAQVYYLYLVALPVHLNVEHQFDVYRAGEATVVAAMLLLFGLATVAWRLRMHLRWVTFPWAGGSLSSYRRRWSR